MMTRKKMWCIQVISIVAFLGMNTFAWGLGPGGGGGFNFGGESRGLTIINGRVLCAQCNLHEVHITQPTLTHLYQLEHQQGQIVMQVASADEAARWESIVGLTNEVAVRTPDRLFQQLMSEENLMKQVQLTGVLRTTNTYDVVGMTFTGVKTSPLAGTEQRAADAAARADAAAQSAEASVERVEKAVQQLETATDNAEDQFNTRLRK